MDKYNYTMARGKKTGGRIKGTPNKLTKEIRVVLKNLMADQIEKIPKLLEDMEPRDRLEMLVKLMPYVLPKIQNANYNLGEPVNFNPFEN